MKVDHKSDSMPFLWL